MSTQTQSPNTTIIINNNNNKLSTYHPVSQLLIIFSAIICVGGLLGNLTIATVILKRKYMRTPINWLLCNLAISDLAIVCITIPGNLIYQVVDWPFGEAGCKYLIMPLMEHFASVGILTHTAIGFARYLIVRNALNTRIVSIKAIRCIIVSIWLISFLVLSVTLMGILGEFKLGFNEKGRWTCVLVWLSPLKRKVYRACVFILTYMLPILMTGYSYSRIYYIVKKSLNNVNVLLPDDIRISRRKKSRRMNSTLILMYVIFAVTTLPLQLFLVLFDFKVISKYVGAGKTFDALLILFYTQILSNPIVLLYMGDDFRKEVKFVVNCRCFLGSRLREFPSIVQRKIRSIDRKHISSVAFATSVVMADSADARPKSYCEYTTIVVGRDYGRIRGKVFTNDTTYGSSRLANEGDLDASVILSGKTLDNSQQFDINNNNIEDYPDRTEHRSESFGSTTTDTTFVRSLSIEERVFSDYDDDVIRMTLFETSIRQSFHGPLSSETPI